MEVEFTSNLHGKIKLDYHQITSYENGATAPTYTNTYIKRTTYTHIQLISVSHKCIHYGHTTVVIICKYIYVV